MGEKPGSLRFFSPKEVISLYPHCTKSTHHQNFLQVIDIANKLYQSKFEILIIGIQPDDVSFGEGLSTSLKNNLEKLVEQLIDGLI
jgi:hydrogenase maturation protease